MEAVQLSRGKRELVANAASAGTTYKNYTSRGHSSIIIYAAISGSGQWDVTLQGLDAAGNYIAVKDINGNTMGFSNLTASDCRVFKGIPDKFQFVTNEDSGTATITLSYELFTM